MARDVQIMGLWDDPKLLASQHPLADPGLPCRLFRRWPLRGHLESIPRSAARYRCAGGGGRLRTLSSHHFSDGNKCSAQHCRRGMVLHFSFHGGGPPVPEYFFSVVSGRADRGNGGKETFPVW